MANGWGGSRPGAGRPSGAQDVIYRKGEKRRRADRLRLEVTQFLKTTSAAVFEGDSLELAISIYKNENLPLQMRLHALALALPFERPRLVATASVTKHIDGNNVEFGRLFAQIEQRLALAPPERRAEVIDMLREDESE